MALIRPFVPAQDFAKSCAFYEAIGFVPGYRDATIAIFDYAGAGFLLQNYYVKEFAENCMLQLFPGDLDAWWLRTADLVERFGVQPPRAPADTQWGLRVGFLFDPSGVLWQVSETLK